jgi:SNF2 family DNA or RNA helicase
MARAELLDDHLRIAVATAYTDRDRMVQVPGATWHKATGRWHLPVTWAACLQLRGVFGTELEVGSQLAAWAWQQRNRHIAPALLARECLDLATITGQHELLADVATTLDQLEEHATLRLKPFQRAGVAFLVAAEKAVLADEMGSGKTPQAIRAVQALDYLAYEPFPLVVICPNSLKNTVWVRELAAWAPGLTVTVVEGSAGQRRKQLATPSDVYVVNWEAVRLHSRLAPFGNTSLTEAQKTPKELNALNPRTVILDEAHRLRNVGTKTERLEDGSIRHLPQSQQTLAAWAVAHQAEFRFALTGTPVNEHVGDLWGLLHTVLPDWYPAKTRYLDRYAETSFGMWGGLEVLGVNPRTDAERRAILEPTYRRIPKAVSLPQLPPKLPVAYRETPMTPKQAVAYRQMEATMLTQLNELLVAPNPLAQFTRLLQFAAAHATVDEAGKVHLAAPSAKVDDLVELLEELGDESLVVAAPSRELIELAAARLTKEKVSYGFVTGAFSPVERARTVARFQEGYLRVILLTHGAGAEGITLTRARTLLYMQRSWSPLANDQVADRIHRIGSEHHASVQYVEQVAPGTVEERKREVLAGKEHRIEEVIRDRETVLRLLGGRP